MSLLITCEGGGASLPSLIDQNPGNDWGDLLSLPDAVDRDALWAARRWSEITASKLIHNEVPCDLIDVRHSLHHRGLWGPLSKGLTTAQLDGVIREVYHPYRNQVRDAIRSIIQRHSFVLHLSLRSFPLRASNGKLRRTDVGLLYDPKRNDEVDLCLDWIDEMYDTVDMLKVRRNYPSRGTNDSLTKSMRSEFPASSYLGIDVWLNRAWAGRQSRLREEALVGMARSLEWFTDAESSDAA